MLTKMIRGQIFFLEEQMKCFSNGQCHRKPQSTPVTRDNDKDGMMKNTMSRDKRKHATCKVISRWTDTNL